MKTTNTLIKIFFFIFTSFATLLEATGMQGNTLTLQQQRLIPIASFTANGDMEKLKVSLHQGLDDGLSINAIKEVMIQLYAYAGFPRSLNALGTFKNVVDERVQQGKHDTIGEEASPLPIGINKDAYGAKVRADLLGQKEIPSPAGYQLFAPTIDTFLKEHLFADIFARDILDYPSRELVTISALSSLTGTNAQLRSHLAICLNVGFTPEQLHHFVIILGQQIGEKEAKNAHEVLMLVVQNRK